MTDPLRNVRYSPLLGLSLLVLGVVGCGDPGAEDEGIPRWDVVNEPTLAIGEVTGGASYLFSDVAGAQLLPGGALVVADRSSGTLRIFDDEGRVVRSIGGRGEGPGEFVYLNHVSVQGDTLSAYDSRAYRLTRFTMDGELVSTTTMEVGASSPEVYLGRVSDGEHIGLWLTPVRINPNELAVDEANVGIYDANGEFLEKVTAFPAMRRLGSPLPFSPHPLAAVIGDTLYVTDGLTPDLRAHALGSDSSFTIPTEFEAVQPERSLEQLRDQLDSAMVTRLKDVRDRPEMDSIPTFSDLLTLGDDLLLKLYDPSTDSHWLRRGRGGGKWVVISTDGNAVARIPLPPGLRLLDVGRDRIVGLTRDSLGVERIQVHQLTR